MTGPVTTSTAGRDVLVTAVAIALISGFAQAAIVLLRRVAFGTLGFVSVEALWLGPIGQLMLFSLPALVLAWLARKRPRLRGIAALLFLTLAFWSIALRIGVLHPLATLALSAGLAWRLAGPADAALPGASRGWRRAAAFGIALTLVAWGAVRGGLWLRERSADRSRPKAAAGALNVLILLIDTARASAMSMYGSTRPTTPRLEARARRGVIFDWAIAPAPWTLPSHATLFTGRTPNLLDADWVRPLEKGPRTLAESFAHLGYRTAAFGGNHDYVTLESGLARGFGRFVERKLSLRQALWASSLAQVPTVRALLQRQLARAARTLRGLDFQLERYQRVDQNRADGLNAALLGWIDRDRESPFFAFVNYFDVHEYAPRGGFQGAFGGGSSKRDLYDQALAWNDHAIEAMLDSLDRAGLLARTLVVVTSDHGENFGEQGLSGHGKSVIASEVRIPLLMFGPGVPESVRVTPVVSLADVGATILALARAGSDSAFPGTSLVGTFAGGRAPWPVIAYLRAESHGPGPEQVGIYDSLDSYILDRRRDREDLYPGRIDSTTALAQPVRGSTDPRVLRYRALAQAYAAADRWLEPRR